MAGRIGIATEPGIATGTALKTLIQLAAAANHAIKINEVAIGFHGVDNVQEPILVQLVRQTTAGTMTSLTLFKNDDSVADSLDTSAQHTATVEPTTTDILRSWTVHPQTGLAFMFPEDTRPLVGAGDRVGLIVTSANDIAADPTLVFEE